MGKVVSLDNLLASMEARRADAAPWLGSLLDESRVNFASAGLPNRRVEAWRYSDLAKALHESVPASTDAMAPPELPGAAIVAFENGVLDESSSTYAGLGAQSLRQVLGEASSPYAEIIGKIYPQADHPILSLNTALMEEGIVLRVPAGVKLAAPLHLRFNWTGDAADDGRHLRVLILLEEGAEATIFESHDGAPSFSTIVSEFSIGAKAKLTHVRLENLGASARQTAATLADLGAESFYRGFYFSQGGHFARHEALVKLAGEECEAQIDAAYMVADKRHCDNTTVFNHAVPNTRSKQAFRGVLSGMGRGVYQGCVKVAPQAQKTDARQMSRAMLLSHRAEIVTKPELEIYADDVKCSHGATAGELDAAALFFLRARGIPEVEARAILVEAFLAEAMDTIADETLRNVALASAQAWLSRHAGEVSHVE